ncbi:MAG: hypothetical protein DRJ69_07450 [Thermoprotei archaeon]|nr:MAG: hypothetical protein DRJ69_07450 [Thermoprotei archaeon]
MSVREKDLTPLVVPPALELQEKKFWDWHDRRKYVLITTSNVDYVRVGVKSAIRKLVRKKNVEVVREYYDEVTRHIISITFKCRNHEDLHVICLILPELAPGNISKVCRNYFSYEEQKEFFEGLYFLTYIFYWLYRHLEDPLEEFLSRLRRCHTTSNSPILDRNRNLDLVKQALSPFARHVATLLTRNRALSALLTAFFTLFTIFFLILAIVILPCINCTWCFVTFFLLSLLVDRYPPLRLWSMILLIDLLAFYLRLMLPVPLKDFLALSILAIATSWVLLIVIPYVHYGYLPIYSITETSEKLSDIAERFRLKTNIYYTIKSQRKINQYIRLYDIYYSYEDLKPEKMLEESLARARRILEEHVRRITGWEALTTTIIVSIGIPIILQMLCYI